MDNIPPQNYQPTKEEIRKGIEDTIKNAEIIFKIVKSYPAPSSDEEVYAQHKAISEKPECAEFIKMYPIPFKYMVAQRIFRTKAFRKFLLKLPVRMKETQEERKKNPNTNPIHGFLKAQADYVMFVYQEINPRCTRKELSNVYESTYNALKKESDDLEKRLRDQYNKDQKEQSALAKESLRETLVYLKAKASKEDITEEEMTSIKCFVVRCRKLLDSAKLLSDPEIPDSEKQKIKIHMQEYFKEINESKF